MSARGFEFALERAVFVSVLHCLFVWGSDRSCENWMDDYAIPGAAGLRLYHLYRAMVWLGEAGGRRRPRAALREGRNRALLRDFPDRDSVGMSKRRGGDVVSLAKKDQTRGKSEAFLSKHIFVGPVVIEFPIPVDWF